MAAALDEEQFVRILKQEASDAASYHNSDLAKHQEDALKRFLGAPYPTDKKDGSQVVTQDLADTIEWIMPDLMRTFMATDELVSIRAGRKEDDQPYGMPGTMAPNEMPGSVAAPGPAGRTPVECQAAYLAHIFFQDNDGETNIYDFIFDGLLQRCGLIQASWEDPEPKPPQLIEGVSAEQVARYVDDPEYEILGAAEDGDRFLLEVRHRPRMGRCHIEAFPPEEFRIHKRARSIPTALYHARERLVFVAELARQHPEKAEDLKASGKRQTDTSDGDGRVLARHGDATRIGLDAMTDRGREQCVLSEEYIRIDYDGDGVVELRYVKRVDDIVLQNEAVVRSDIYAWTPSRISHRAIGRSIYDMLKDIQRIRTQITRYYLDGLGNTLNPRTYVKGTSLNTDGMDALLANEQGAVINTKEDPHNVVLEATSPDVSQSALAALEHFDQRAEISTGVTRQSAGMDPTQMNKTATGIDLLQAAAKTRVEAIARWAGKALEDVFEHVNFLLVNHQDGARSVKLFGEWLEMDPRRWNDECAATIHVGSAGVSKQQQLGNLAGIAQKQESVMAVLGPANPLAPLSLYRNTLVRMVRVMGFRDDTEFFGQITADVEQQLANRPDPKQAEAQAKQALAEQEAAQKKAMQEAEFLHTTQIEQFRLRNEKELAIIKANNEAGIARAKILAEETLARFKIEKQMELDRWKAEQEISLARANVARDRSSSGGVGIRMGGAVG